MAVSTSHLEALPFLLADLADFDGAFLERCGQDIFGDRFAHELFHFLHHFLHHEAGRQDLVRLAYSQAFQGLVKLPGKRVETHQIITAIFRTVQWVHIGHERRELVLDTEKLVNRIIVELPLLAIDLVLKEPLEHMGGQLLRRRLTA